MRVLVTGGAGYVGSHVVRALMDAGHRAVVLDDLSEGHREALPAQGRVPLVVGDISDPRSLDACFQAEPVDGVIHMAASCLVGQSMTEPARYFDNNVARTLRLVESVMARGVNRFVFSSSAAVYGEPPADRAGGIDEETPCSPTNVYGETKLMVERALDWHARCAGLRAIALRYFNAAGAAPGGRMGEDHEPETHLIPLVCRAALGKIPAVTVMGRDYPTPDGTCLRDYVHVTDLADAHVKALAALESGPADAGLKSYNLGAESAMSVLEVIAAARRVTGREIPVVDGPRRPGDPAVLLASSRRVRAELGWKPVSSDLTSIIKSAWDWHREHPDGYAVRRLATP
ncbi:MAG: UDP-glucose 4-epimerase GalE [Candidatus Polarisedimenticolia bacterium]